MKKISIKVNELKQKIDQLQQIKQSLQDSTPLVDKRAVGGIGKCTDEFALINEELDHTIKNSIKLIEAIIVFLNTTLTDFLEHENLVADRIQKN